MNKICSKCKLEKDVINFYSDNRKIGRYRSSCIECHSKSKQKYYEFHKKQTLDYAKHYRILKREKILKTKEIYRLTHKKQIKEYKSTHKEVSINSNNKRRALIKETDITSNYLKQLKESTKNCPLCNLELNNIKHHPQQYNLDHIVQLCIGGKHTKNNVRYICKKCNLKRTIGSA